MVIDIFASIICWSWLRAAFVRLGFE